MDETRSSVFFVSMILPGMFAEEDSEIVNIRRTPITPEGLKKILSRRDVALYIRRGNEGIVDALRSRFGVDLMAASLELISTNRIWLEKGDTLISVDVDGLPNNGSSIHVYKFFRP